MVCLAAGFLFGLPALRLEGLYLALATFALGIAMPQILKHKVFEHWTGGSQGLVIMKPDPPEWLKISQDQWLYFFVLAWAVLLFFLAWNLLRGRVGRAMVAIRDQPVAAQAMGVNTALVQDAHLRRVGAVHRHRRRAGRDRRAVRGARFLRHLPVVHASSSAW